MMVAMLTALEVVDRLRQHVIVHGSQRAFAKKLHVSVQFLNMVLHGKKAPAGKVLAYLGLERHVCYFPKRKRNGA